MIRDPRGTDSGAGAPDAGPESSSETEGRGASMRVLFDEILAISADQRTRALRAAAVRDGLDDDLIDEVRGLLAFVEATRIDDAPSEAQDRPDRLVGCRLGGFTLDRLVGIGGTAAVFEATQERPRRTVAVKVLRHVIGGRRARRRFEREVEIAGRLDHPSIARVYDSGTVSVDGIDTPWLAMEYIEGAHTLTSYARDRSLDLRARVQLMRAAIAGVSAAHRRGVIHRDLKPANLLVDPQGRVRVIDFGIARPSAGLISGMTATVPGQILGTVPFMAPEQLDGDPDLVDVGTDIYALGVVLHLLLVERMPYETMDCNFVEAARRIREVEVGSLRRLDPRVDRDLDGIVQKALAKDPAKRYATMDAFDADLVAWLEGRPVVARPLGMLARTVRTARRHPAPVTLGAAVVVTAIAAILVLSVMLQRESGLRRRGDQATARAALAAAGVAFERGDLGDLARRVAQVPPSERGWEFDWLISMSEQSEVVLEHPISDVISVDVIPAGDHGPEALVATGYRGTWVYDLPDIGLRWRLPEFSPGGCWKHVVLPDRSAVLVAGLGRDLQLVDLESGEVIRKIETDGAIGAMWAIDDDTILLGGDDGSLQRMDLASGEIEKRVDLPHRGITTLLGLRDGRCLAGTATGPLLEFDATLDEIEIVRDFGQMIPRIRANRDQSMLAVCTHGDVVELLDAETLRTIRVFDDHDADVWDARFDEEGGRLVTASLDEAIRVFDLSSGLAIQKLSGPYRYVWSLALSSDARHAWYGCSDGSVRRQSLLDSTIVVPDAAVAEGLAWSPEGDRLAVRTDLGVSLLSASTRRWLGFVPAASGESVFASDSGDIEWTEAGIWCSAGRAGGVWRIPSDLATPTRLLPGIGVTSIDGLPDGGIVVATADRRLVRLAPDGTEVASLAADWNFVSVAWRPPAGPIYAQSPATSGWLVVVEPESWREVDRLRSPGVGVNFGFEISPDGALGAIAGRERPGNVFTFEFDRMDDRRVRRIGHAGDARHVRFLDGGRRLVSGGDDGRVILGVPDDSDPILTMFDSRKPIRGLAVSPDGLSLAATDGRAVFIASVEAGIGSVDDR